MAFVLQPPTKEECEVFHTNCQWCHDGTTLLWLNLYCPLPQDEKTEELVQRLNLTSLNVNEVVSDKKLHKFVEPLDGTTLSPLRKYDKVLTDRGFCYTTNMQNHDVIFNEEISKDFDSYKRKLVKQLTSDIFFNVYETPFNDTEHWSLANGYPTGQLNLLVKFSFKTKIYSQTKN